MVYCTKCGQDNQDDAQFCNRCGQPIASPQRPGMEARFREFGEEVGRAGKKLEAEVERRANSMDTDFDRSFGLVGPLIKAVIGFVVLIIITGILNALGDRDDFIQDLGDFLTTYLAVFLIVMVIFAYSSYMNRRRIFEYYYFQPLVSAVGITFAIWLSFSLFYFVGVDFSVDVLTWPYDILWILLPSLFILVLLVGFATNIPKAQARKAIYTNPSTSQYTPPAYQPQYGPKKLYRSGRDRILGGVCGGFAEYFNIDPILIRIIWILLLVASFGLFLAIYLLLWIIVPRDPGSQWG
jgi:phage shock protein C